MSFYIDNYTPGSIPVSAYQPQQFIYPRTLLGADHVSTVNVPLTTYRYINEYYNKKSGLEEIKITDTFHNIINLKYPDFTKLSSVNINTSSLIASGIPPFVGVNSITLQNNKNLTNFNFSGALSLFKTSTFNLGAILSGEDWYNSPYVTDPCYINLSGSPSLTSFTQNTIVTDFNKIIPLYTAETGEPSEGNSLPAYMRYNFLDTPIKEIDITLNDDTNYLSISSATAGLSTYDIKYGYDAKNKAIEASSENYINLELLVPQLSSNPLDTLKLTINMEPLQGLTINIGNNPQLIPAIGDVYHYVNTNPGKSWFTAKKAKYQNITLSSYKVIDLNFLSVDASAPWDLIWRHNGEPYYFHPAFTNLDPTTFTQWLTSVNPLGVLSYGGGKASYNNLYTGSPISLSSVLSFYNSVNSHTNSLVDVYEHLSDDWIRFLVSQVNTDNKFIPNSLLEQQYRITNEPLTGRGYPLDLNYNHFQVLSTSRTESITASPTGPGTFGATNVNFGMNKNSVYKWPLSCLNNVSRDSRKTTLIHPQYGIVARHFLPGGGTTPVGATVNFTDINTSITYTRTITNYVTSGRIPSPAGGIISNMEDLGVVKLNSPLPVSAFPGFNILPKSLFYSNSSTKIPNCFSCFFLSQDMDITPRIGSIERYPVFSYLPTYNEFAYFVSAPNYNTEIIATQSKIVRVGDSSHPTFMFINKKPVINGVSYAVSDDIVLQPSITHYYPHIQAIVNELEGTPVQLNLITQDDVNIYSNFV